MKHIAAYLLLQTGGNSSPSAADIKKLLGAAGIEADEDRLNKLISELESKDISELISEGKLQARLCSLWWRSCCSCCWCRRWWCCSWRWISAAEACVKASRPVGYREDGWLGHGRYGRESREGVDALSRHGEVLS